MSVERIFDVTRSADREAVEFQHEGGDADKFAGLAERLSAEFAALTSMDIVFVRQALARVRASDGDEGIMAWQFFADSGYGLSLAVHEVV